MSIPFRKSAAILIFFLFAVSSCIKNPAVTETRLLEIHDIQGCSHTSPYQNRFVANIRGIVTTKVNNGFYMQGDRPDELDCSSEAVFVFTKQFPEVLPGYEVQVSGKVDEFILGVPEDYNLTLTEIIKEEVTVVSSGNDLPVPVVLGEGSRLPPPTVIEDDRMQQFDPTSDGLDFFESLESMIVELPGGIVIGPRNQYGEIAVVLKEQLSTNQLAAEGALLLSETDMNPERILVKSNWFTPRQVNIGDTLLNPVTGIMDYSFGNYKIIPFNQVELESANNEIPIIEVQEGNVSIVSYNVENLSRFDSDKKFSSIARQIVKNLDAPDFVVLHEILDDSGVEDNGVVSAEKTIEKIISALQNVGGPEYSVVDVSPLNDQDGGIIGGNIRSIILYRSNAGISLVEDGLPSPLSRNPARIGINSIEFSATRKPLTAVFQVKGRRVIIIAAHLTSRGADSPLYGNAQPPLNPEEAKREKQAETISKLIRQIREKNNQDIIILAGDMNDYPWSETIRTLSNTFKFTGPVDPFGGQYSYILDGNAFLFDYLFIDDPLSNGNESFQVLHLNTLFDSESRMSDHDPVIASINLE